MSGNCLKAKFHGSYEIQRQINDVNYIVKNPDRMRKTCLCQIIMIKEYRDRKKRVKQPVAPLLINVTSEEGTSDNHDQNVDKFVEDRLGNGIKLQNSDVLTNHDSKLAHLHSYQRDELKLLLSEYARLFPDNPTRTSMVYHDVDVGESKPIKQYPCRLNPVKMKHFHRELQYMLENDIVEPSKSPWSSPSILVPKPDGSYRFCTDYRKVNSLTKSDSHPIPRIDDCIDKIGQSKFITKIYLLKGYWQIPLSDNAKEICAFVTSGGLYQYKVMPFGLKNVPATSEVMNIIIFGLKGVSVYIDDVIVASDIWEEHIQAIRDLFKRLSDVNSAVNLTKTDFLWYFLGHVVGHGQVKPVTLKVEAINHIPPPNNRKELMKFIGMIGYYRKFCKNLSQILAPLTDLLSSKVKFVWTELCQSAFETANTLLTNEPVLIAPDFTKQVIMTVDASDQGIGAVLMQEDSNGIQHPICYFFKKLNKHQKVYSTIEKEGLALISGLQHFEVYLSTSTTPIIIYTDHNPLVFINKMKNNNRRLMR